MKFSVHPKIFVAYPDVQIGVLVITRMDNAGHSQDVLKLLGSEEQNQKQKLATVELGSLPEIAVWRKIYKDFGSDPRDYPSSIESLLRRARGGQKPLPQINNLVDLYNYISLKYHLPAGAEDLDKVKGDIELAYATGEEKGIYLGGKEVDTCYKGEIVYKDSDGFICRRWNWREADRTKIDFDTVNSILVIEKTTPIEESLFIQALDETKDLISKHLKAKCQIFILESKKQEIEIEFQKGKKAEGKPSASAKRKEKQSGITKQQKKGNIQIPEMFTSWFAQRSFTSQLLGSIIVQAVKEVFDQVLTPTDVQLDHPSVENYGDYSSNIALILAGKLKMQPSDVANQLAERMNGYIRVNQKMSEKSDSNSIQDINQILKRVETAGPGFLNFWLQEGFFITQMHLVLENNKIVKTTKRQIPAAFTLLQGKKVAVEYTDPNPFKEFHLGHLYSNVIGEAISRLFEAAGAKVWRGDFYGDVGMHVAKSVWGMMGKMQEEKVTLQQLEKLSIKERQQFLGQGYAMGVRKYEENPEIAEEIKDINYLVYISGQEILKKTKRWKPIIDYKQYISGKQEKLEQVYKVYEAGLRWSLEYFETIYKKLGTKFDGYYPESWVGEYGMKMVEKGLQKRVLERSDGAVVFKGEKYGLHTRVFVNKLGLPTYETKDLGLAFAKYQDFKYDLSINVFGKEIDEYYYVVKSALKQIDADLGKKAYHIAHGMVKLPEGKMSSRTGNVITFEWLVNEAKQRTLQIMQSVDLTDAEKQSVAEKVGLAAIRYALLKSSIGNDVVFDFEKSITFEGESGPYLLYTYARCRSVLRKAKEAGIMNYELGMKNNKNHPPLNTEELSVLRHLLRFEEVVLDATRNLSPNLLCGYLFDLAQKYNLFYNKHNILQIKNDPTTYNLPLTTNFRLALTAAVAMLLNRGLHILGIETVERM